MPHSFVDGLDLFLQKQLQHEHSQEAGVEQHCHQRYLMNPKQAQQPLAVVAVIMDLTGYEVPRVLITCRSQQLEVKGEGDENVPLYYYVTDNLTIQFEREEFCLVTGLKFGVENLAEYGDVESRIPFRRRVFLSNLDGEPITSIVVYKIINSELFDRLDDDDAISLCCQGILQLVLLGVEGKRRIPTWLLRLANDRVGWDNYPWGSYVWPTLYSQLKNANVKRWPKLYATQPTSEIEINSYSIFGYTWSFKRNEASTIGSLSLVNPINFSSCCVGYGMVNSSLYNETSASSTSISHAYIKRKSPKLQEALDEEAILEEQILALMHRFADRFTDRRVEINNLMVLQDHPLIEYGKYALGCMTGADMKKCVYLKSVRDELLRSMEEKRQLMTNYRDM
ncbi:phospholipase-like protein [Tanacetum coccineum]